MIKKHLLKLKCKNTIFFALLLSIVTLMALSSNVRVANALFNASFDFDSATPVLYERQSTPLTQTSGTVTLNISSPSDPAAFSIQSYDTTFYKLSEFSGKYMYDNNPSRDILDLKFNVDLLSINFTFATIEYHGGPNVPASDILMTAYHNSALAGSTTAHGTFTDSSYPQGTLLFTSVQPFNWVRITVPPQTTGTTEFLIDNIMVTGTSVSSTTPTPSAAPLSTPLPSNAAPSATPSSSPPVPEFSFVTVILLVAVFTLLALLVTKIKRTSALG